MDPAAITKLWLSGTGYSSSLARSLTVGVGVSGPGATEIRVSELGSSAAGSVGEQAKVAHPLSVR